MKKTSFLEDRPSSLLKESAPGACFRMGFPSPETELRNEQAPLFIAKLS